MSLIFKFQISHGLGSGFLNVIRGAGGHGQINSVELEGNGLTNVYEGNLQPFAIYPSSMFVSI